MKEFLTFIVLLLITSPCVAGAEDSVEYNNVTDICEERGHVLVKFNVYRDNVKPQFQDYPDSTVMYYYKDNRQMGITNWCKRCKKWIGAPDLDKPLTKIIWRRKYEEINDSTGSDTTFSE